MESESKACARLLPVFTKAREERMRARVPLSRLSVESEIPAAYLSEFERGLRKLTPSQEARRREALRRLKE